MKNNLFRILFLMVTYSTSFAQADDLDHAKIFNKCEITYTDGKIITGFIAFFVENRSYDFEDMVDSSIERAFNLDDNSFEFKLSLSANVINMSQKGLKRVKIFYENQFEETYDLMNIKVLDENNSLVKSSRTAWLPLVKDDVISLYQRNIYLKTVKYKSRKDEYITKRQKLLGTLTYIGNKEHNIAFQIYGYKRNIFKEKLNDAYLGNVLKYIFNDCPAFLDNILVNDKWEYSRFMSSDLEYESEIDRINDSDLNKNEKFFSIDKIYLEKASSPFVKLIEEYKSTCK